MRYMAMARENEKIINQGFYEAEGEVFHFASPLSRLEEAEIYGPKVLEEMVSSLSAPLGKEEFRWSKEIPWPTGQRGS